MGPIGACLSLSSTTTRDEQTNTAMMAREREKATHGIGVVRQGVGCTRVEAGGGLKGVMGDRREREKGRRGRCNDKR